MSDFSVGFFRTKSVESDSVTVQKKRSDQDHVLTVACNAVSQDVKTDPSGIGQKLDTFQKDSNYPQLTWADYVSAALAQ